MNEAGILKIVITLGYSSFFLEIFSARRIVLLFAKKRSYFPLRLGVSLLVSVPCYFIPSFSVGSFSYGYLAILLIVFACGLFLYQEKPILIFYSCFAAWGIQHIAWNLLSIFFSLIPNVSGYTKGEILSLYYCGFVFLYGLFFLCFYLPKVSFKYSKQHFYSFFFAAIRLLVTRFLSQSVKQWYPVIRVYTILVSFLSLLIRIAYPYLSSLVAKEKTLAREKKSLEKRLSLQARQQELSKETIDVVNRKFHDRKNQLLSLENSPLSQSKEIAKEIEKDIDLYKDIARTGNEALDIIITQKALLCSSKGIRFTYRIDGSSLSFRSKTDIVSLYGNIIDNAIEASENEEGEYRLIKLKTYRQNDFVLIREENYCHKKIIFSPLGLPLSSKKDSINHGYGTKSIQYIVQNYHGQVVRKQEKDIFSLSILIPLPGDKEGKND